ncbi:hypothetical protein LWI28_029130 [Acer negundo]|uniref:RNase H type-1 domain-containing protein n=1 Tax=Acer negundo TaxID=4023 RepID=A0AAD5IHW3_ACENE|nr:hypothetical protein LWI28_029130 [Acer negundo]
MNDWIHNGKRFDVNDVVWWSRNYIYEFRRVSCNREGGVATNGRIGEEVGDRWKPPNHGVMKTNCDCRMDKRRRRVGFGIIFRDGRGKVLRCWAQGCKANYDLEYTKAMTIYKGLLVGRDMGLVNYIVEFDSESVINHIVNGSNSDAIHGGILDSIQGLVSDAKNVEFIFVLSKAKRVAFVLANEALKIKDVAVWREDAPMCIRAQVEEEQ